MALGYHGVSQRCPLIRDIEHVKVIVYRYIIQINIASLFLRMQEHIHMRPRIRILVMVALLDAVMVMHLSSVLMFPTGTRIFKVLQALFQISIIQG